jgi:hypothetical protein
MALCRPCCPQERRKKEADAARKEAEAAAAVAKEAVANMSERERWGRSAAGPVTWGGSAPAGRPAGRAGTPPILLRRGLPSQGRRQAARPVAPDWRCRRPGGAAAEAPQAAAALLGSACPAACCVGTLTARARGGGGAGGCRRAMAAEKRLGIGTSSSPAFTCDMCLQTVSPTPLPPHSCPPSSPPTPGPHAPTP